MNFRWLCTVFTVLFLTGPLLSGCGEERETQVNASVRTAGAPSPVANPPAELLQSQQAFIAVSQKATPAVVNIRAERVRSSGRLNPLFEEFFGEFFRGQPRERRERSLGSGFLLTADGYILTNEHVVSGAEEIKVQLTDRRVFPATLVGVDPKTDVAVIRISAEEPLPTVVLGDSDRLQVGQWALAIGNPFGLDSTLTVGVISATGRTDVGIEDYEDFIQTDASINPGNSGGPLLNIYGEVVGINTAIVASGQGIGFAIPINLAKQIADQLISTGEVTRGWLGVGIQSLDAELAKSFGLDRATGALVTQVIEGTPADDAGLRRGDILLSFDGKPVHGVRDLQLLVASASLGRKVPVEILRDGKRRTVEVAVVARQKDARESAPGVRPPDTWLGMSLTQEGPHVKVTMVEDGSVASRAGIEADDLILAVNHRNVDSLADVAAARDAARNRDTVLLLLQRGETSLYVALPTKQ